MAGLVQAALPEDAFKHLHWKATVNLNDCTIDATAAYTLKVVPASGTLNLAVYKLVIQVVQVNGNPVDYELQNVSPSLEPLHKTLAIDLPREIIAPYTVAVTYRVPSDSLACHWFASKWLITQSYPCYAPSFLPTPPEIRMKFTYSAEITTTVDALVLMSATKTNKSLAEDRQMQTVSFELSTPVQSQALALLIAPPLTCNTLSNGTTVYSAMEIDTSLFEQVPALLDAAEATTGLSWIWPTWSIVVLPEMLDFSFATVSAPSLLVCLDSTTLDDMANAVAQHWTAFRAPHETWQDVWISEGWTKWHQRELLKYIVAPQDEADTWLSLHNGLDEALPLVGEHVSSRRWSYLARDKGYLLLLALQDVVGEDVFSFFASAFIAAFEMGSATSEEFHAFAIEYFTHVEEMPDLSFDWNSWLYTPGYFPPQESIAQLLNLQRLPPFTTPRSLDATELVEMTDIPSFCSYFVQLQKQHGSQAALDLWMQCCDRKQFHPSFALRIEDMIERQLVQEATEPLALPEPQPEEIEVDTPGEPPADDEADESIIFSSTTAVTATSAKRAPATPAESNEKTAKMLATSSSWLLVSALTVSVCLVSAVVGYRLVATRS
ncbi:unnamed protein product [Aphanomyces euteiches]